MKNLFLAGCFICSVSGAYAASNQDHCAAVEAADKLDGATLGQCLCAYDEADKHLTPEMKQILMKTHLTGENPMAEISKLGDLKDLLPKMMAYGKAVESVCGL